MYYKIPSNIVSQYKNKRYIHWFEINPIETATNNEWVVPVDAIDMLKTEIRGLTDELTQGQIDLAVNYIESLEVLDGANITWIEWDENGNRIN